jgi:hypothetical protein
VTGASDREPVPGPLTPIPCHQRGERGTGGRSLSPLGRGLA